MGFAREVELAPSFAPVEACRDYFGYFPAAYRAQSLLPGLLAAEIELEGAILYQDSALSHGQKERLLLVLASAEGDFNRATTHYEMLRLFGETESQLEKVLSDYRHCGLPAAEVALLGFALKLSGNGPSVSSADIEHLKSTGWADELILEAVLIAAWHRFFSTISAGLGARPEFPPVPILHCGATTPDTLEMRPNVDAGPYLAAPEVAPNQLRAGPIFRDLFGFIPNVFRGQAVCPTVIQAEAELLSTLLTAEEHLSRRQKEKVLVTVSAANRNEYTVALHSEMLTAAGVSPENVDKIAVEHGRAGLSEADVALLDFALGLANEPSALASEDWAALRSHGYTDEQIIEGVVTTGLTNFLNTV